ncbi:DUF5805 domain-containing protein [Salinibaculum rarum]|uniref:DUF5805 domain-containing protein n=1 Tax=Salinibaculum rarum TaxID=3058903 RepID=UPI00265DCBFF|nr:DUF5805 domain-containing protein [Salinibaculum sp. KK48]
MAADSEDTSKVVVQTYLPEYQRDEWDTHADELGMSRSEFVKTMVQAGRRGFEGATKPDAEPTPPAPPQEPTSGADENTQTPESLREAVVGALSADDYRSWDELLATVTDDIESQLEETLQELQADDRVRYSGRHGGYTLDS